MAKAEILVPFILRWEGGFSDDPDDRGGATNKGVTLATFRHFYGSDSSVEQLRNMTYRQWFHIFKTGYWNRWRGDEIESQPLANLLVDWVWASGVHGIRLPQRILGVKDDGLVGPQTLRALNGRAPEALFRELQAARIAFVEGIARRTPSQKKFLNGWKNRIAALPFGE